MFFGSDEASLLTLLPSPMQTTSISSSWSGWGCHVSGASVSSLLTLLTPSNADDDNDLKLARLVRRAYLPGITAEAVGEAVRQDPERFHVSASQVRLGGVHTWEWMSGWGGVVCVRACTTPSRVEGRGAAVNSLQVWSCAVGFAANVPID